MERVQLACASRWRAARAPARTTPRARRRSSTAERVLDAAPEVKMVTFSIDGREVTAPENVDARRRRQVRRRRDPGLLLRAQARRARRRLPHVPGRDRGHPEAADRVLDAGQGRHGRPHAERARAGGPAARWSSSCSSTTRSTAPSATRAASARCRTSPTAGAPGTTRFIEPKRHFRKPLELSPLIAIDRERCILCYRCVRFSPGDLRGLPARPAGARRARLRLDLRRHAVRRAVQRQHHRAVPGGRAHVVDLPLPRAAVGHRGLGHGLRAVPVAVQRPADRPRRPRHARAGARPRRASTTAGCATRAATRFQYTHADERITQPLVREGVDAAARRRGRRRWPPPRARAEEGRRQGGRASSAARRPTRRRSSCSGCCARASARPTSRRRRPATCPPSCAARSPPRACRRRSPDLEFAHTVLLLDTDPVDEIADLGPAHPQGRAPPQASSSAVASRAADGAGPQRRTRSCASRRARSRASSSRSTRALARRRGQPVRRRVGGRHAGRRRPRPRRRC